ncbi:MAG: hypothetical protein ACYC1D_17940 [Acidimicrobiales bacterium]
MRRHQLPHLRLGRRIVVPRRALQALLENRNAWGTSQPVTVGDGD